MNCQNIHDFAYKYKKMIIILTIGIALSVIGIFLEQIWHHPNVELVFLYSHDSSECIDYFENANNQIFLDKNIEIVAIDISLPVNKKIVNALTEQYNIEFSQLPVLVRGKDSPLEGESEINEYFAERINIEERDKSIFRIFSENESSYFFKIFLTSLLLIVIILVIRFRYAVKYYLMNIVRNIELRCCSKMNKSVSIVTLKKKVGELSKDIKELTIVNSELLESVKQLKTVNENLLDNIEKQNILRALIGLGDYPVDLLSEAQRILYWQDKLSAEYIVRDVNGYLITLLDTICKSANLRMIAPYNQVVKYKKEYLSSSKRIPEDKDVRIIETGWILDKKIIKKAKVEEVIN